LFLPALSHRGTSSKASSTRRLSFRSFATSGGRVACGVDISDQYRQAALYIDQILKETKPADLPVQQLEKFELDINLRTEALGLTVPRAAQRGDQMRKQECISALALLVRGSMALLVEQHG
jgi:hypothetical protein